MPVLLVRYLFLWYAHTLLWHSFPFWHACVPSLALSDLLTLPALQGSVPARPATRGVSVSWAVSAADSGSTARTLAPVIQVPK
jgi:hypothetical protein